MTSFSTIRLVWGSAVTSQAQVCFESIMSISLPVMYRCSMHAKYAEQVNMHDP